MVHAWLATAFAGGKPAGELLRDLEHLQVVGSVLYVAAHPDDENTRLIAWLEGQGLRTAYLSMTRGDGGQNRIGPEQDELLGVLRTGELLAARSVDGGEQRFTRMRDFGYSKSSDETLRLWGHEEALDDVVRAIRAFRPDVIVTRFPTTGETHGHHLASAILAGEAFTLAADPSYVTPGLEPWQADRLIHNKPSWNLDPATDTSGWSRLDVGTWDPLLGVSWGERSAVSRSMHKSQGFGSAPQIGPLDEWFVPVAGTAPPPGGDPLAGLDLGWSRFEGTRALEKALRDAAERFDPRAPHRSLERLAKAHARLADVPDAHWRERKRQDLEERMAECAGLWLAARTDRAAVAPGGTLDVTLTAVSRAPAEVVLRAARLEPGPTVAGAALAENTPWSAKVALTVPADTPFDRPHWLVEPSPTRSRYAVSDPALRDLPDTPPVLQAAFDLEIAGVPITLRRPVEHAWTDPVAGERIHPVEVLPPVTATFARPATVLPPGGSGAVRVTLRSTAGPAEGVLRLATPPGITAEPAEVRFALAGERVIEVRLTAASDAAPGPLSATVEVGGTVTGFQQAVLDYPHLPRRTVLAPATHLLVPVAVARGDTKRVGYVAGSGDAVADGLRAVGYEVEELDEDAIASGDLGRFDAIVMGIRAYNTRPRLLALHEPLMRYVAGGGRLLVQYNTNNRFDPLDEPIGPFPFTIGRERVTDETAAMVPVDPAHPALVRPNPLGPADFEGWVQERGLYFASEWDPAYEVLFAVADPGEEPLRGGTLVARHGEGVFVYTGLAFFRQIPAGVPGAYRLLANLLAL